MYIYIFKKRSIRITNIPFVLMVYKVVFSIITFTKEGSAIIFVITTISRPYVYSAI
jgi:hypothetical protein